MKDMNSVPILFIIFNRPDTTSAVFEKIRQLKPLKLFIAADGPRKEKLGEEENCRIARSIVAKIDWECELKTLFHVENLGCGKAVSQAITWFFENVEEGIILEDDCLPNSCFFEFCKIMLERYKNDERIMHIGGTNFQDGFMRGEGDYYYSRFAHVWGWATWKRAWQLYDLRLSSLGEFVKTDRISAIFFEPGVQDFWLRTWEKTKNGLIDTWDYQWSFAVFSNNALCITPNKNLVSNIGFGANATHTLWESEFSKMKTEKLCGYRRSLFVLPDPEADLYTIKKFGFKINDSPRQRLFASVKKLFKLN